MPSPSVRARSSPRLAKRKDRTQPPAEPSRKSRRRRKVPTHLQDPDFDAPQVGRRHGTQSSSSSSRERNKRDKRKTSRPSETVEAAVREAAENEAAEAAEEEAADATEKEAAENEAADASGKEAAEKETADAAEKEAEKEVSEIEDDGDLELVIFYHPVNDLSSPKNPNRKPSPKISELDFLKLTPAVPFTVESTFEGAIVPYIKGMLSQKGMETSDILLQGSFFVRKFALSKHSKSRSTKNLVAVKTDDDWSQMLDNVGKKVDDHVEIDLVVVIRKKMESADALSVCFDGSSSADGVVRPGGKDKGGKDKGGSCSRKTSGRINPIPDLFYMDIMEPVHKNKDSGFAEPGTMQVLGEYRFDYSLYKSIDLDDSSLESDDDGGVADCSGMKLTLGVFRAAMLREATKHHPSYYSLDSIGKSSTLYVARDWSSKAMRKVTTSEQLLAILHEEAQLPRRYKGGKLHIRVSVAHINLGEGQEPLDTGFLAGADEAHAGLSQEDGYGFSPPFKMTRKEQSNESKLKPIKINALLDRLYSDPDSPLYHGFNSGHKSAFLSYLMLNGGMIDESDDFPDVDKLIRVVACNPAFMKSSGDVMPAKGEFKPVDGKPPPVIHKAADKQSNIDPVSMLASVLAMNVAQEKGLNMPAQITPRNSGLTHSYSTPMSNIHGSANSNTMRTDILVTVTNAVTDFSDTIVVPIASEETETVRSILEQVNEDSGVLDLPADDGDESTLVPVVTVVPDNEREKPFTIVHSRFGDWTVKRIRNQGGFEHCVPLEFYYRKLGQRKKPSWMVRPGGGRD